MTGERWERLDAVLDAVLDLPAPERAARVREICADDEELAAEALRFLADADRADGFLARSAGEAAAELVAEAVGRDAPENRLGQRLGAWELTGILGEGGMGVVYAARRADGQYEAEAAVKLMLSVDPHSPLRRRLLEERQILARLDDPRVARLYDGGLSDDGHPYLVMERVTGRDLLAHCDAQELGLDARLVLFGEVCAAVHAAHQRLVLHCDLKPSNILVTDRGELKLLDFGIARPLDTDDDEGGAPPARLLTPGYASPEQRAGAPLTTASDVFGLGVLLHELLTGVRPPEPPAAARASELARTRPWARRLRGDLDNILARALAEDPARRYGAARDLADDLARWRRGLPVDATPSTFGYRLRRRVARNRLATAALVAVVLAVVGGGTVSLWQARVAAAERDQARREAARAAAVNSFLTSLFDMADPNTNKGTDPTVMEVLDRGRERIGALRDEPATRAPLLAVLGHVYFRLGRFEESRDLYRERLAAERALHGTESAPTAAARIDLASAHIELGELDAAAAQIDSCLAYRTSHPRDDPRWIAIPRNVRARLASERHEYAEAVRLYEKTLATLDHGAADRQEDLGRSYTNYAAALARLGRTTAADSAYARSLEHFRRAVPEPHSYYGTLYSNWALVAHRLGDLERAEGLHRRALAIKQQLKHNRVEIGVSLINIGKLLVDMDRADEALPLLTEALEIQRDAFGDAHLYVGAAEINVGDALLQQGDASAAAARFRAGQAVFERAMGDDNPAVAVAIAQRGRAARASGELDRAADLLREAVAMHRRHLPSYRPKHGEALLELAEIEAARGRSGAARELASEAATVLGETIGEDHEMTARARSLATPPP